MNGSLRQLHDGAHMASFADEMAREYAVASRVVQRHDFLEGVRAVIIDKDNAQRWNPVTPDGVTDHVIDQIFAPLPDDEVWTPRSRRQQCQITKDRQSVQKGKRGEGKGE